MRSAKEFWSEKAMYEELYPETFPARPKGPDAETRRKARNARKAKKKARR